ncbi:uncharacterized protein LOC143606498 [Bidens hawaiensis]|uniref:uncharacterized protein LOC143606498 n=1 Tax=Bidens hawaiensis TaxID=980011 RepID=UPI00404A0C54
MRETSENITVMMECSIKGDSLLPIPLDEEFIYKVKDGVGHILSWPTHLVIRSSDLEKTVKKPFAKPLPKIGSKNANKRLREPDEEKEKNNGKEKETGKGMKIDKEKTEKPHEEDKNPKGKGMETRKDKKAFQKRKTRAQQTTRVRIEESVVLTMAALVVDAQLANVDSIKVQSEDECFGYESYTYLGIEDFEAVFTLGWMSGSIVTSYMM